MPYDLDKIAMLVADKSNFTRNRLVYFAEIDSTNTWLLAQPEVHGWACLTDYQRAGRGRRGSAWVGPVGGSILLSMGWRLPAMPMPGLSLVSGLAVRQALEKSGITGTMLKWPNDILYEGRKLGGILVETAGHNHVVGVGLNRTLDSSVIIDQPWTDLVRAGFRATPEALVAALIDHHEAMIKRLCASGFGIFAQQWNDCHAFQGQEVVVTTVHGRATGRARGVNDVGELLVEEQGCMQRFGSGVQSVRLCGEG